jgi:hypothetical protein
MGYHMHDWSYAQAVAAMKLSDDDEQGERALVSIRPGRKQKPLHTTVSAVAERKIMARIDRNQYVTLAKYAPGTIHAGGGRTSENAVSCDMFPFDADLKDYFQVSHEYLQGLSHEELDHMTHALLLAVQEGFARAGIPIHRIDATGYGVAGYSYIHPDDQRRVADIRDIHKRLVERINSEAGGRLVDPAVSDPLARFMRLVGSQNHKGPEPRRVYTLWEAPDTTGPARLDAYPVESTPVRRAPTRPVAEKRLSEETIDEIVLGLSQDYTPGSRNAIAFGLPAMLYKAGVPRDQAHTIVERVGADDEELDNRTDAVDRTYDHGEAGHSVTGYRYLVNFLSPRVQDILGRKLNRFRQAVIISAIEEEAPLPGADGFTQVYDPPPANCFYGLAGEYRNLIAPCTSGPDAFHLASWLTYAGATIGRKAHVWHAGENFPMLYTVLIGETGDAHKDTCADFAAKFWRLQERSIGTVVKPVPYRTLSALSTWEGLLSELNDNGRVVVHTREFNQLLDKAGREVGAGLRPGLTRLWDGVDAEHLPTRKDPIQVTNPWVSLLSTVTPHILSTRVGSDDIHSGFANRILWVFGSGKGRLPRPPRPDEFEQRRLITETMAAISSACRGSTASKEFTLAPDANVRFDDWDEALYEQRKGLNPDDKHLSQRLQPLALRIALIFAATDGTPVIAEDHLDAAITFVEWQFEAVRKEARLWGGNDDARLNAAIKDLLRPKPLLRKEIAEALPRWGTFALMRSINAMLDIDVLLEDAKTGELRLNGSTRVHVPHEVQA